jgi:hypothetical protein
MLMHRFIATSRLIFALLAMVFASTARADYIGVPDASLISYAVTAPHDKVFLRNLDTFNSSWHGCCGYYWFDLTTPAGQAQFATLLTAIAQKKYLGIYIASASTGGVIDQVGHF